MDLARRISDAGRVVKETEDAARRYGRSVPCDDSLFQELLGEYGRGDALEDEMPCLAAYVASVHAYNALVALAKKKRSADAETGAGGARAATGKQPEHESPPDRPSPAADKASRAEAAEAADLRAMLKRFALLRFGEESAIWEENLGTVLNVAVDEAVAELLNKITPGFTAALQPWVGRVVESTVYPRDSLRPAVYPPPAGTGYFSASKAYGVLNDISVALSKACASRAREPSEAAIKKMGWVDLERWCACLGVKESGWVDDLQLVKVGTAFETHLDGGQTVADLRTQLNEAADDAFEQEHNAPWPPPGSNHNTFLAGVLAAEPSFVSRLWLNEYVLNATRAGLPWTASVGEKVVSCMKNALSALVLKVLWHEAANPASRDFSDFDDVITSASLIHNLEDKQPAALACILGLAHRAAAAYRVADAAAVEAECTQRLGLAPSARPQGGKNSRLHGYYDSPTSVVETEMAEGSCDGAAGDGAGSSGAQLSRAIRYKLDAQWTETVLDDFEHMKKLASRREAAFTLAYILGAWVTRVAYMAYSCNTGSWPSPSITSDLVRVQDVKLLFTCLVEFRNLRDSVILEPEKLA
jgi:hypothetical protein